MLAVQQDEAQSAAAGFPGLEDIARAASRIAPQQPAGRVSVSFWGPGLSEPGAPPPSEVTSGTELGGRTGGAHAAEI